MSVLGSTVSTRVLAGVVVAAALVTAGLIVSPSVVMGTLESLAADPVVFGFVVAGLYAIRPLLAWPTTPLAVVVGYGFGVTLGIPIALVGLTATVLPVFLVARWVTSSDEATPTDENETSPTESTPTQPSCSSNATNGFADRTLERAGVVVVRYFETAGPIRGVTAARLAPIPSDISTCAAAVSGVRLRHFLAGTILGELPWTVAAVVVGASAATVTTNGLGELGVALSVACGLAAAVLLAGPAYRLLQKRTHAASSRSTDG
ncbi:TVP38/TMEM64 family protein [Natronolimnobius baerhuensis]|uniref:TVP38/TMEM64 family protein n=1 Tax=Natronolimnobius baerhuensis TaxID=253108 RepID=A0A202E4K0_9EURY|nr:VTT domain-containing protein [Natronolimnobius baerhuensis]OVE83213.1 TVP38/TMEM64 family protein [Natronolimnobius baerhuensis]